MMGLCRLAVALATCLALVDARADDATGDYFRAREREASASLPVDHPNLDRLARKMDKAFTFQNALEAGTNAASAVARTVDKAVGALLGDEAAAQDGADGRARSPNAPESQDTTDNAAALSKRPHQSRDAADAAGDALLTGVFVLLAVAVVVYVVAYLRVSAGKMVVYRSWGDFFASAAWVVLLPLGYVFAHADGEAWLVATGKATMVCGWASAAWLLAGAFANRRVLDVVLAVPARILVALLVAVAWGKLKEGYDGYRSGRKGAVDGLLIPLAIALFIFNALVAPLVGDHRTE